LQSAEKGFYKLMDGIGLLPKLPVSEQSSFDVKKWKQSCYDAMNDDFNSPVVIAHLFEALKYINAIDQGQETITAGDLEVMKETMHAFTFDILGLEPLDVITENSQDRKRLSQVVELLISLRKRARDNRDFETSDKIRDELGKIGIELKDRKEGTTYSL